ncbi:MAG: VTT domain-containing protein [Pseudomonadota bacterium]
MAIRLTQATVRGIIGGAIATAILVASVLAWLYRDTLPVLDEAWLRGVIGQPGIVGPGVLIGLMVLAVIASPIPSGPIAIAAGAIFGTMAGAIYVIIGAVVGAILAFAIARSFGHDAIRRSDNAVMKYIAKPRSQWSLMAVVFASRLVPFVSFDAVSYAAGFTNLTYPRFAIATLAGCAPVSFALAAMGAGLKDSTISPVLLAVLAGVTLVPVAGKWLWDLWRGRA